MTKHEQEDLIERIIVAIDGQSGKQGTPWGTLAAWAGVVVVVIGSLSTMVTTPMWQEINENKALDIRQESLIQQNRIDIAKLEAK